MNMKEFAGQVINGLEHYQPVIDWQNRDNISPIMCYCISRLWTEVNRLTLLETKRIDNKGLEDVDAVCLDIIEHFNRWDKKRNP